MAVKKTTDHKVLSTIVIPLAEYQRLKDIEKLYNSLRELVINGVPGAEIKLPTAPVKKNLNDMTRTERKAYIESKYRNL